MAAERQGRADRPGVTDTLDLGLVGDASTSAEEAGAAGTVTVSRRGALLTAGGVLVAGVLGFAVSSATRTQPANSASGTASGAAVEVGHLARPLPSVAGGWELFALGGDVLVRVQPASGRVVRTRVPPPGDGQVSFVPVGRGVLIRPVGAPAGYVVPDDGRPAEMPSAVAGVGAVLPGPDLDHVWTEVGRDPARQMALVSLVGGRTAVVVAVPEFATTGPMTDGAGGLLFEGVGGLYRISPTGHLRISNAIVLAVGGGRLLTLERDTRGRWRTLLRSRDGGVRVVPVAIGPQLPHGVLSPDGRSVVLYVVHESAGIRLTLVDLLSGVLRPLDIDATGVAGDGTAVWSPDGRWLFCVDAEGEVRVIEPGAPASPAATLGLPPVRQLAIRTTS